MNNHKKPHGNTGRRCSEEKKAKIRAKLLGRKLGSYSEEHRSAISAAKKGKSATPAMLAALEKANEVRRMNKGSNDNGLTGYKQTPEHRAKIGAASRGHTMSPEGRKRVSEVQKARVRTDEERQLFREITLQRHADGRFKAYRSKIEISVGWLLEPFGFKPQFRYGGHPFDYGNPDTKVLIEVNGCYWHSHGCLKKDVGEDVKLRDAEIAKIAACGGFRLITLWQCEEKQWPVILKEAGVI